jgi:hypothetical protein
VIKEDVKATHDHNKKGKSSDTNNTIINNNNIIINNNDDDDDDNNDSDKKNKSSRMDGMQGQEHQQTTPIQRPNVACGIERQCSFATYPQACPSPHSHTPFFLLPFLVFLKAPRTRVRGEEIERVGDK